MKEKNKEEQVEETKTNDTEEVTTVLEKNDKEDIIEEKDDVSADSTIVEDEVRQETPVEEEKEEEKSETQIDVDEDKEPTKEFEIVDNRTTNNEKPKGKGNKKIVVILIVIIMLVAVGVVAAILLLNNDKKENKPSEKPANKPSTELSDIECQNIMKKYGDELAMYIESYIDAGSDLEELKEEALSGILDGYEVKCNIFDIEEDGSFFLDECSINGSEYIYSYQFGIDEDYIETDVIHSEDGVINFCYSGYGAYEIGYYDEDEVDCEEQYSINCEEENCVLTKSVYKYALVEEEGGKKIVYEYGEKNKKIYTLTKEEDATFMLRVYIDEQDDSYVEDVFALILKNKSGEEALYSLNDKKIVFNYGKYEYDWEGIFSDYPVINQFINVYSNKKMGLVDINDYNVVIEPKEYDELSDSGNYIFTTNGKYKGLLYYDYDTKKLSKLLSADTYDAVFVVKDYVHVVKNEKIGVYDSDCKTLLLNGQFYDAAIMSSYNGGQALVLDGNTFKLLDKDGNVLKTLGELASGSKKSADFYSHGAGAYYDDEDETTHAYLKFTNPKYDKEMEEYNKCLNSCEGIKIEEELSACEDACWENVTEYNDCTEYYYTFESETFGKETIECYAYAKPVLYLYPKLPTIVNVTFDKAENLTTTYPKYNDGWTVLAKPNGDLLDSNGKYYYALYWEEDGNHSVDFSEGFYVTKDNAIEFLEEKLTTIGFNDKERNEFIMYWLPILEKNERSLVYFELTEERETYSKINIKPAPDSLLRVAIHVKKVDSYTPIKEQRLPRFKREGFVAVEWGGVLY